VQLDNVCIVCNSTCSVSLWY